MHLRVQSVNNGVNTPPFVLSSVAISASAEKSLPPEALLIPCGDIRKLGGIQGPDTYVLIPIQVGALASHQGKSYFTSPVALGRVLQHVAASRKMSWHLILITHGGKRTSITSCDARTFLALSCSVYGVWSLPVLA